MKFHSNNDDGSNDRVANHFDIAFKVMVPETQDSGAQRLQTGIPFPNIIVIDMPTRNASSLGLPPNLPLFSPHFFHTNAGFDIAVDEGRNSSGALV